MIKAKKRVFNREFKQEAALLVLNQNYSIRDASKAMGIGKSTLSKWVTQLKAEGEGISPKGSAITPEQQRIKELEKRIKRVELENSILKKATALLMSDSLNNLS